MTNFEQITKSAAALAKMLIDANERDLSLKWCSDKKCCNDVDDDEFICTDEMQIDCILGWLGQESEE